MYSENHFPLDSFNDATDSSNLRREWEEWHRSCEIVLELKHIESQHEKLLFLLARGGRGLQRIYDHLAPVAGEIYPEPVKVPFAPQEVPEYDNAVKRLNAFFVGKRNERIELEVFRSLRQATGETFNRYILKLRTQAACCNFGEREEKELLQQISVGAIDEKVKDKGLEGTMNLDELINYAINREILLKQKEKTHPFSSESGTVALVSQDWKKTMPRSRYSAQTHKREQRWGSNERTECNRCGSWRHRGESRDCIARNAACHKCGVIGHFGRKCTAHQKGQSKTRYSWKKTEMTNALQDGNAHQSESGYSHRHHEKNQPTEVE